jgi:hypothetical protein
MLNIFIIPSTIQPLFGVVNDDDRFNQTLETIESIKKYVSDDSFIILADSSARKLDEHKKNTLKNVSDMFLDYSDNETCQEFNKNWLKSHGENYLLWQSIQFIQNNLNIDTARVYKLGGRCHLLPSFNVADHTSMTDMFVFKKRLVTWRTEEQQKIFNSTHLLETRLYSWPYKFNNKYLGIIQKNFSLFAHGLDTEHAHFINIDKTELCEYDKINVGCIIAASGAYIED